MWQHCTCNVTTLSHPPTNAAQGTCCYTSVSQFLSPSIISPVRIWSVVETDRCFVASNWLCCHQSMQQPTACNCVVGKGGMINCYKSVHIVSEPTQQLSTHTHCCEIHKWHWKAKNATSISSQYITQLLVQTVFRTFTIKVISNNK
jgi:hypothetical protein